MSIETMTKLATVTVGAGGSASIDFTNIPQTYTDLVVVASMRKTGAIVYGNVYLKLNGSSTNFTSRWLQGTGAAASSFSRTDNITVEGVGDSATASTFGNFQIYIPNYTGSNYKSFSVDAVGENNATTAYADLVAGLWSNTAAITSLSLDDGGGADFAQHSTATLYGIRNARRTVGNSIKATGGNISFDGTYVVHTFTSSGTFTPTANLTADYLVVAGGGGSGATYGGGGGAGGLRCTVDATGGGGSLESKLYLSTQPYAIIVGAGGTAGNNSNGTNGTDSSISGTGITPITATGGGYGGWYNGSDSTGGGSGGSGGGVGAGYVSQGRSGGSGTANQGYRGGNLAASLYQTGATGGGGAGAIGEDRSSNNVYPAGYRGGNGGSGITTRISGISTTYAGGGGGASRDSTTANGGTGGTGGGGNGQGLQGSSQAGTANTGGGGGGGHLNALGTAGGSGIVIIRYKA